MQLSKLIFCLIFALLIIAISVCESQDCAKPPKPVLVSQSGYADFTTIQSAIDYSVPSGNSQWIHIRIAPGIYREKVVIPMDKPCIYLEGAGRTITSIEWDDHGNAHFSATFSSKANNTVAKGLAFKNTYNLLKEGSVIQAVAVRIHADKCAFIDCGFLGVQDTLFDSYGRHYYYNCYIQGGTDFIFGCGQSIFEASTIDFSTGLGSKIDGVITASERDSDDSSGFVFKNCNITGTGGKVQLGRALEGYARVIIANSFLSDVVRPEGWSSMGHDVSKITFVEEGCYGPGANKYQRVPWMKHLSGSELDQFVNISFIDTEGWIADIYSLNMLI